MQSVQSMTNSKTCCFSIHDHKSTGTDSNPRGHSKPRNSLLFHQLESSDVVKLVYTLKLCDCPCIPTRRPGTIWSPRVLWLRSTFSGRSCSSRALIKVSVLILGWSKRTVTVLWRVVLDSHRKLKKQLVFNYIVVCT